MAIEAKVICDSISPTKARITTMQLRYPRFIHSEFMTHRVFSRNASSSRAIPAQKMIDSIAEDPALPIHFGLNQRGMQAYEEADKFTADAALEVIRSMLDAVVDGCETLKGLGIHKQVVNRYLEPWSHISVVVTATDWDNFFALRYHHAAQPEIRELAKQMYEAMQSSTPTPLDFGEWHLPYIKDEERYAPGHHSFKKPKNLEDLLRASTARCARVSYLTHDKKEPSLEADLGLYERLYAEKHLSPFEHQATPLTNPSDYSGNFMGWLQYRKTIKGESYTNFNPPKLEDDNV